MNLPRVIILNQPFNNNTGGGITLTNLFRGWKKNSIGVVCSGYLLTEATDTQICDTYYQLGHKEQRWIFPLNLIKRKYPSGPVKFDKPTQDLSIDKSKIRVRLIMNYMYPLMEKLGILHGISKNILSNQLRRWLSDFDCDVIYAQAQSREDVLFCLAVQHYLGKPMVFHMMDDWPSTIKKRGLLRNWWSKRIDTEIRLLFDRSTALLSISEYMADEYKRRYGKDFLTFHNPVNISFWKEYQKKDLDLSDTPTIMYAGRIGLGIDSSLQLIAEAVAIVNSDLGISLRFVVQSQEEPSWIKKYQHVSHQPFAPYADIPAILSNADFLIIPYDFSKNAINYIKYSMPTKAPEYMACGTPIIVLAPGETAIAENARKHRWAAVVSQNSKHELADTIKHLIRDKTRRDELSANSTRFSEENYGSENIRARFKDIILAASRNKNREPNPYPI